ncbi:MAG: trypsin-like serine peptidase [Phycisphaerales bacterium]
MRTDRSLSRCLMLAAFALIAMLGFAPGAMAQSDCCVANGTPGCDNAQCQNLICGQDPFCCNNQWDQICADAALQQCAICSSDCCFANGTPGCDNAQCQNLICGQDPFCCNNQWDQICADAAVDQCAVCSGSGGSCAPACGKANVECLSGPQYDNRTFVGRFSVGCTAWIIAEPNIVITNAHCNIGSPASWSVEFNFECDACTGGGVKPTQNFSVQSVLLVDNTNDIMIMRLNGNPAATFGVATLDPSVATVGLEIYEIHHAEGEVKGFDEGVVTGLFLNVSCPGTIQEHSVSVIASQGASGSPVFRVDNNAVTAICNCGPPCSEGFVLPMSTIFPAIQNNAAANGYTLNVIGQGQCGSSGSGDCCVANGTPFCNDQACCELVCASDPFCCDTQWDQLCADQAAEQCEQCFVCGSGESGDCCVANGTPYCNNAACCETVCAEDPFCCNNTWDDLCAEGAAELCGALCQVTGACCLGVSSGCIETTKEECGFLAGAFLGAGSNCAEADCESLYGACCSFPLVGECTDGIPEEACTSFNPDAFFYGAGTTCEDVTDCTPGACCLPSGQCVEQTEFECDEAGGTFNGVGVDCSEVTCAACGTPEAGSCCENNGTPFCDDQACCELICAADPFCCNTSWDQICADAAIDQCVNCFACGSAEAGSCCESNGTPYCNDAACCESVCAVDPFCCNTTWDDLCAEGAAELCGALCGVACDGDLDGDGDTDSDDLGILLSAFASTGAGDLDNDGDTDSDDLGILLSDFGCGL